MKTKKVRKLKKVRRVSKHRKVISGPEKNAKPGSPGLIGAPPHPHPRKEFVWLGQLAVAEVTSSAP